MCKAGDPSSSVPRPIDIVEGNLAFERIGANSVVFDKAITDKQSGGPTVHHSRYESIAVPAFQANRDPEV